TEDVVAPSPNGRACRGNETMSGTIRIAHPAFSGSKRDETVRFYTDVLGMELVLKQPNLDYPSEDHYFFHVGNDNFIAYFLPRSDADAADYRPAQPGSGWLDHLAIDVDEEFFQRARERLQSAS